MTFEIKNNNFIDAFTSVLQSINKQELTFYYKGEHIDIWSNIIPVIFPILSFTSYNPDLIIKDKKDEQEEESSNYTLYIYPDKLELITVNQIQHQLVDVNINWNIDINGQPNVPYTIASSYPLQILLNSWNTLVQNNTIRFPYLKYSMKPINYYYNNLKNIDVFSKERFEYNTNVDIVYGNISYELANKIQLPGISFQSLPKKGKDPDTIALSLPFIYTFSYASKKGILEINTLHLDYIELDCITNYFSEPERMKANVKQFDSPYMMWTKNSKELIEFCLKRKLDINNYNLHESMYHVKWKETTLFKVTLAKTIYKLFLPNKKRILDISSGWGDRLIAALSIDCDRYLGFDPNLSLQHVYNEIISTFEGKEKCQVIPEPFESGILKVNEQFDIVFSSPPYFDFETYSNDEGQSIIKYNSYSLWVNSFFLPSLRESVKRLTEDGILAIHISDTGTMKYIVEILLLYVLGECNMSYVGCIFAKSKIELKRGQPIWVFKKSKQINTQFSNKCKTAFITLYKNSFLQYIKLENIHLLQNCKVNKKKGLINPKLIPSEIKINGTSLTLISDTVFGGTKTRFLSSLIDTISKPEIVYAGPDSGMAQIAIGVIAKIYNKKATIFVNTPLLGEKPYLVRFGQEVLNINYNFGDAYKHRSLKDTNADAIQYVNDESNNRELLPFGLHEEQYISTFTKIIKDALSEINPPERCWIVAGSGTLLNILQSVWPSTSFLIVQVGKDVSSDKVRSIDKLYIAPEFFSDYAKIQPPYDTIPWYDAKVWQFVLLDYKKGDYVWNVSELPTVQKYCDFISS